MKTFIIMHLRYTVFTFVHGSIIRALLSKYLYQTSSTGIDTILFHHLLGLSFKYNTVTTKVYEAVLRLPHKNTYIKLQRRLLGEQEKVLDPFSEDLPER